MKLPRRQFLHLAAGAVALPVVSRVATAQTYPAKPVRIVGCGQLLMYRYFGNSILIDLLPELFPPGFRERERSQA